jgi:signal transduction histidine kinase
MRLSLNAAAIRQRFGPSLARRVFLAIVIANTIVLAFIFYMIIFSYQNIDLSAHTRLVRQGSYRLNEFTNEQDAKAFGAAWQKGFGCAPFCHTEVWTHDGRRIYSHRTTPDQPQLIGVHGQASQIVIDGVIHDLFRHDGSRWSLRMIKPRLKLSDPLVVQPIGRALSVKALIFFAFLMLPLWFAVRRGLSPLRSLALHLGQRQAGDLTPLNVSTRYRELKPLVAALDGLLFQLRSKVQREYAFLQDATHELRTPIAVIPAQAHILAKAATPSARAAAKQQIDHALARAFHLIAQLSELARVDTQSVLESRVQDVVALVKLDLMQMEQAALARQIALQLAAPDTLLHPLESNTFLSIFHNLVSNAIRYGRVGGRVVVTLRQEDHHLFLSVADDGPGISPAQREQVFERFYRGLGHDVSGSGLGLAIVRQACSRLNARLELHDGLAGPHGHGCCFSVWIPDHAATPEGRDESRE